MTRLARLTLTALVVSTPIACATAPTPTPAERLGWIAGDWEHVDGETTMIERWRTAPDGDLLGFGTVRVGPQLYGFAEALAITGTPDGAMMLVAWPTGQDAATFAITLEGPDALIAQRTEGGFPTRIRYRRIVEGDAPRLEVTATGPGPGEQERTETIVLAPR